MDSDYYPFAEVDTPDGGDGNEHEDDDDSLHADLQNGNTNVVDGNCQKFILAGEAFKSTILYVLWVAEESAVAQQRCYEPSKGLVSQARAV